MARRPPVKRATLAGIPVYQAGGDGPVRAGLFFRVGRQDEQAADAGITHLVEHLALFPFGQQHYEYNGTVDSTWTTFWCAGDADEVAGFLSQLVRNLHDLPLDRLETEQRVLLDEASRRPGSAFDHHAWLRYGLRGAGLGYLDELGLYRVGPADVRDWAARYFTAGNVSLVWTGSKLPRLELGLPAGDRMAAVAPTELVEEPTWAPDGPNLVTFSVALPRTHGPLTATRILSRRLQQVLRYERGLSYDVSLAYQPLSADVGLATIGASTSEADAAAVRDVFANEIDQFRQAGPTASDLAADLERMRRDDSPLPALAEAARMAALEVLGGDVDTDEVAHRKAAEISPEVARAAFDAAAARLILTVPPAAGGPSSGYAPYPLHSPGTVEGRQFHDVREKTMSMRNQFPIVTVGDDGISMLFPDASSARVLWRSCVLLVVGRDRSLTLVDESGGHVSFHPSLLANAADLEERVIARVAERRIVRLPFDAATFPTPPPRSRAGLWLSIIGAWLVTTMGAIGLGVTAPGRYALPGGVTPATQVAGGLLMVGGLAIPVLVWLARRGRIADVSAARAILVIAVVGYAAWVLAGGSFGYAWALAIVGLIAARYARLGSVRRNASAGTAGESGRPEP